MLCRVIFIFWDLCLVFCTSSCFSIAALCLQPEQGIPEGGRRNGVGFHITDFVLTVMVSGRVVTDYGAIVHTNYS